MPEFRDCAVICIPDDNWGEMVCAVIVPVEPSFDDAQTIVEAGKKALGPVKAPKSVHFVQALPSTAVGKVDKQVIRAQFRSDHVARSAERHVGKEGVSTVKSRWWPHY